MKHDISIIISCAGMGTRLGMGLPKCLVEVEGKPLIIRQLEQLEDEDDIRIVIGYKAELVEKIVKEYRSDIKFFYNYEYATTGTAASFSKGLEDAKEWVVSYDGDLLVNRLDLRHFLDSEEQCIGGCIPTTDFPVLMKINEKKEVIEFSRKDGQLEWTGLAIMKKDSLIPCDKHVYMMFEHLLPLKVMKIRTKEIDTLHDYKAACEWVRNGCC